MSSSDFDTYYSDLEKNISEHTVNNCDEILHTFSVQLFLSDTNLIKKDKSTILREAENYIAAIKSSENLILNVEWRSLTGRTGLTYHQLNTKEFRKIVNFLELKAKELYAQSCKNSLPELLKLVDHDAETFFRKLANQDDVFFNNPILLNDTQIDSFVNNVLQIEDKLQLDYIFHALSSRYKRNSKSSEFIELEIDWLLKMQQNFDKKLLKTNHPHTKWRIQSYLNEYLTAIIEAFEKRSAEF